MGFELEEETKKVVNFGARGSTAARNFPTFPADSVAVYNIDSHVCWGRGISRLNDCMRVGYGQKHRNEQILPGEEQ